MQNQLLAIKFISSIILPQIAVMPVLVYTPRVYINFLKSITDQCTVAMAIRGKKRYHNENHQRFYFCYVLYVHVHVHYLIINSWNWNEKVHLSLLSLCVHTSILCPV